MASTLSTMTAYASLLSLFAATTASAFASPMIALPPLRQEARNVHIAKRAAVQGCYSSSQGLSDQGTFLYQSTGHCAPLCSGKAVYAMTGGNDCLCGDTLPPANSKVDASQCSTACVGFPADMCGGTGFYSVYLTGSVANVQNYGGSSSNSGSGSGTAASSGSTASPSSAPGSSTASPSVLTSVAPGQTVVVTQAANSTESPVSSGGGGSTNVAGLAAGVVVGVVAAAALIAAAVFFIRNRRKQAAEDEYKRATQVTDFVHGSERKPGAAGYSGPDSRLDPETGARRNSHGSIADDQDYSRRILRVANPDDSR